MRDGQITYGKRRPARPVAQPPRAQPRLIGNGRRRRRRGTFDEMYVDGTVVIGEGERDDAPMPFIGGKGRLGAGRAELARGDRIFAAADVTDGPLLAGAKRRRGTMTTQSVVMRASSDTVRWIKSEQRTGWRAP